MKNFKIYELIDSDNQPGMPDIVQIFDWAGTADEWRETLEGFRSVDSEPLNRISIKWMEYCVNDSTQILYAEGIDTEGGETAEGR